MITNNTGKLPLPGKVKEGFCKVEVVLLLNNHCHVCAFTDKSVKSIVLPIAVDEEVNVKFGVNGHF